MPDSIFIFPDANPLSRLAVSGTASNPYAGLNTLLAPGNKVIISDAVFDEVMKPQSPGRNVIEDWMLRNGIAKEKSGVQLGQPGAGERSIRALLKDSKFSGAPYKVLTEDGIGDTRPYSDWVNDGVPLSNIESTVAYLNSCLDKGSLPSRDYALIRDSMSANVREAPGLLNDRNLSSRPDGWKIRTNEQLGVTPGLTPDKSLIYDDAAATPVDLNGPGLPPGGYGIHTIHLRR